MKISVLHTDKMVYNVFYSFKATYICMFTVEIFKNKSSFHSQLIGCFQNRNI